MKQNKTLYVSDAALWSNYVDLAARRRSSVSREVERLMRADLEAASIEEALREQVRTGNPPNLIREVSRMEREVSAIRFALQNGGRKEDHRGNGTPGNRSEAADRR